MSVVVPAAWVKALLFQHGSVLGSKAGTSTDGFATRVATIHVLVIVDDIASVKLSTIILLLYYNSSNACILAVKYFTILKEAHAPRLMEVSDAELIAPCVAVQPSQ